MAAAKDKEASKRLALSRDQRSVLEAVYAVEKLPDAGLRERLSKYLELSTRQIQVWFQNRRQRAKAGGAVSPAKKPVLNTSTQIMDALFEFSGTLSGEASAGLLAAAAAQQQEQGAAHGSTSSAAPAVRSGSSNGSGTTDSPPATALDCETFEWGLPQHPVQPVSAQPAAEAAGTHAPVAMRASASMPPGEPQCAAAATPAPPPVSSTSDILDAVLGFACHEMHLEVVELWPLPSAAGPASEPLFAHFASPVMGMECNSDLACCRAMLAPRLCESAACTHELAWYGVTAEQKEAFARTGVSLRNLVGVPCLEPPAATAVTLPATPSICGVLVLYTRIELPQSEMYNMLLHALGSAAAAAYALGLSKPAGSIGMSAPVYTSVPNDGPATSLSWLLLAAARALQVDVAEHWTARQVSASRGGGVYMSAEQLLVSERVHSLPDTVLATGERAEALHPFSSHMSRATLYAGKLVWCNGTSQGGALEGVKLPVQTAIGLPLRSHAGGGAAFVLYSLRRLEQSTSVTYFIAQLQVLAAASHAAGTQGNSLLSVADSAAKSEGACLDNLAAAAMPSIKLDTAPFAHVDAGAASGAATATTAAAPAEVSAPRSAPPAMDAPELPPGGAGPDTNMWVPPEAVMSTEQVLSLIECLGEKAPGVAPPSQPPGVPPSALKGNALALDALARFSPDPAEALSRLTPPPPPAVSALM